MTESDSRPWYLDHMMTTTTTMMKMPVLMMMIINFHLKAAHHNFSWNRFSHIFCVKNANLWWLAAKLCLLIPLKSKTNYFLPPKPTLRGFVGTYHLRCNKNLFCFIIWCCYINVQKKINGQNTMQNNTIRDWTIFMTMADVRVH